MLESRSSPHAGSHLTFLISLSVRVRSVSSFALAAGHRRFHGNEPLLGGAEDHRIVAAPAVRIGVLGFFRVQQRAAAFDQVDDGLIGVPNALAVVFRQAVAQDAFFVDVAGGIEAVLHAGGEVFSAVRRRSVDDAGAGIHGDVVGEHAKNFAVEEGMLEVEALELASGEVSELARVRRGRISRRRLSPAWRQRCKPRRRIPALRILRWDEKPRPSRRAASRESSSR